MNTTQFDQLIHINPAYSDINKPYYPVYKPTYIQNKVHENYNNNMYYHRIMEPSYIDMFNYYRDSGETNPYNMYRR